MCGGQLAVMKHQPTQFAIGVGTGQPPHPRDILVMHLEAGQLACRLGTLELKTAGGSTIAMGTISGMTKPLHRKNFWTKGL